MIEIKSLSKSYGHGHNQVHVLKNINLKLASQSLNVLYGRSGCGKSTLLNLLGRLDTPDSGSITMLNQNICSFSPEQAAYFRLKNIGIIFQFFNLLPTLTLEENISIPGYLNRMPSGELKSKVKEALKITGLNRESQRLPHQASGGEIQRAAIARSLINDPKILLADEPTGNLDEANRIQVMNIFKDLVCVRGMTVLIVSHDDSFTKVCDHSFYLENGSLKQ